MNLYYKLFAGTYLYLIQIENRGVLCFSSYFAYSSLLAICSFHMFFAAGLIIMFRQHHLILNAWVNILVGLVFLLLGWLAFVRKKKYKAIITNYKNCKKETIRFAVSVNLGMIATLFVAGINAINKLGL